MNTRVKILNNTANLQLKVLESESIITKIERVL